MFDLSSLHLSLLSSGFSSCLDPDLFLIKIVVRVATLMPCPLTLQFSTLSPRFPNHNVRIRWLWSGLGYQVSSVLVVSVVAALIVGVLLIAITAAVNLAVESPEVLPLIVAFERKIQMFEFILFNRMLIFPELIVSINPTESTPASNSRGNAAAARSRVGPTSSVKANLGTLFLSTDRIPNANRYPEQTSLWQNPHSP